jgi:F0F1-type ATP synthase assembly protein I
MPDVDADRARPDREDSAAEDAVGPLGPGAAAGYALIGYILVLGGAGFAVDRWLGTTPWCMAGGLFLGMALGFYELIKTTWPRR